MDHKSMVKTRMFCFPLLFLTLNAVCQDFNRGTVTLDDLMMSRYEKDTGAAAVVLKEFGHGAIRNGGDYDLVFKYFVRIKILNKNGLSQSNIEIPLYVQGANRFERITSLEAYSYNIENGLIHKEALQNKNVFEEERNKSIKVKKFAIPNVRVGSVIELAYTLESPFIFNFREWEFQSDIPKIQSEYSVSIPGVYTYNITLRGFLRLSTNESRIEKNCIGTPTGGLPSGFSADCAMMKFGMEDIPAFVEEDYMTARSNFLSAIRFELAEIRHPNGRVDKITREWKDAELELRQEPRFGVQLRRGRDIGEEVRKLVEGEQDELTKATRVYEFIRDKYVWNETFGKYSEFGIKKAYDEGKGNVGDINLSLVAALRFAGLDADPVILSTRANGTVVELHPVLSEFNYVVARVAIGEKVYLADATDKYFPFGILPERCLNGKGRVIGDRNSYWIDLNPTEKGRTVSVFTLTLDRDGGIHGQLITTFMGYDAIRKRKEILSFSSQDEYIRELGNSLGQIEITGHELKNIEDRSKSIVRKLDIELSAFDDPAVSSFLFNPFLLDRWSDNPFKSSERLYPVDFGAPIERVTILNLSYPPDFEIINLPEKIGLTLPDSGGGFIFEPGNQGNKLSISSSFSIRKTVFTSTEYHYLKELFSRIIQVQNGELIFRKKT